MVTLAGGDPIAGALLGAIRGGDLESLERLLDERPELASARIADNKGVLRTLLHIATDWPGHFPNAPAVIRALIQGGADPNAPIEGSWHSETPLHWAASSDDVEVLEALLDGGGDIEAPGGAIGGGTPLDDAVAFGQWRVATSSPRSVSMPTTTSLGSSACSASSACSSATPPNPSGMRRLASTAPCSSSTHTSWWRSAQSTPTSSIGNLPRVAAGTSRAGEGPRRPNGSAPGTTSHQPSWAFSPTSRGTLSPKSSTAREVCPVLTGWRLRPSLHDRRLVRECH
jgi:Ankyrin repeats (3 copies)